MKHLLHIALLALLSAGCSGNGDTASDSAAGQKTTRAAARRAAGVATVDDSIDSLQRRHDLLTAQSDSLRTLLEGLSAQFDVIDDPMLVEKYRVARGWKGHDTTLQGGILARVLEDGTIEMVATCPSGKFSSINFTAGGKSLTSASVPEGSALNTTVDGVTRVSFQNAWALAQFVHDHAAQPITLRYGAVGNIVLSPRQKEMIALTWDLTAAERAARKVNEQIPVTFNKLQFFQQKAAENGAGGQTK